jgi:hypothetical protein
VATTVLVDIDAMLDVVAAAFIAGVGLTTVFSIVIYSATRAAELRREGGHLAAAGIGALGAMGLAVCVAGVIFGLKIMAT